MGGKPFFHEVPQEEINKLIEDKKTVGFVIENYNQPKWCTYHEALSMKWGCWSLCDMTENGLRTKISEQFCSTCECFEKQQ